MTLPGCGSATLAFRLWPRTTLPTCSPAQDTLAIEAADTAGTVLGTLPTYSNRSARGERRAADRRPADRSAYQ